MAEILDGRKLARDIQHRLKDEVVQYKNQIGRIPRMVNIMIGDDHGTCAYARSQQKAADSIGISYDLKLLPEGISQEDLIQLVQDLNNDESVNGILIHRPVPEHIDYPAVANFVNINKDLEGINIINIGKMMLGETHLMPCTPAAVMEHIFSTQIDLKGKEVVIVGSSAIVGKPLCLLLLKQMATVSVCHIETSRAGLLPDYTKRADILIVAVGKARLIKGDWIKEGAIVVDVGINQVDNKIVGDVDFEEAQNRASYITPVPGGVGPVTVVMLMRNGLEAFKKQNNLVN